MIAPVCLGFTNLFASILEAFCIKVMTRLSLATKPYKYHYKTEHSIKLEPFTVHSTEKNLSSACLALQCFYLATIIVAIISKGGEKGREKDWSN